MDQLSQYDKNYPSFLAGADLCKRLSGTHSKCHGLSFDVSLPCSSRDPICRTDQRTKIHPSYFRAHGPVNGSHQHLRHHLHQLLHIQFLLAKSLHLAHPHYPVHKHNQCHQALHPSHHLNLVHSTLQQTTSPGGQAKLDTYGCDLNPHWQEDKDHYDNQKINGLTFPRCIRQSAFTQKLDIEGCDPLQLPVAALLYQQANNFWIRKLAHGRELYLIPTGDIAAVVFMTELLTQLRNKGVDLDKVSHSRARQDGKLLDKTNSTKYAAQQIADLIHSWVPTRTADPETQHELTQLRSQLAQVRQRMGEDTGEPSTPATTGPSASSPVSAPIQQALLRNSNNPALPAPPGFDPSSLLVGTTTLNPWLAQHMPSTLAVRAFNKWLKELPLSEGPHRRHRQN